MAGGGRPYFFTPWTDRPRTDRTDRWGHRNKHPLVAESSLDSRNDLQHVIWGDLGGSREGLGEAAAVDRGIVVSKGLRRQDPSHRSPGDRQSIGCLTATPQRVRQNKCQIGSAMGLTYSTLGPPVGHPGFTVIVKSLETARQKLDTDVYHHVGAAGERCGGRWRLWDPLNTKLARNHLK